MSAFGILGIGGSLGACAYCGEAFLLEILTGKKTVRFSIQGNELCAHVACFDKYKDTDDWRDLPKGPLFRAALRAHEKQEEKP